MTEPERSWINPAWNIDAVYSQRWGIGQSDGPDIGSLTFYERSYASHWTALYYGDKTTEVVGQYDTLSEAATALMERFHQNHPADPGSEIGGYG